MGFNIGKRIQFVAKVILFVHLIFGILGSFILLNYAFKDEMPILIFFAISSPIIAYCVGWMSSALLFAFGQLVENVAQLRAGAYGDKDFLKSGVPEPYSRKENGPQIDAEFGDWLKEQFNSMNQ